MNSNRGDKHIREAAHGGGVSSGAGSTDDRWAWLKHGKKVRLEAYGLDPETLENILSISVIDVQDEYRKITERMDEHEKEYPSPGPNYTDYPQDDPYWSTPEGLQKRADLRSWIRRKEGFKWNLLDDLLDGKDSPLYGERVRDDDGELQRIVGNFGHIPLALPVTPLPTEHEQLVSSEIATLPVPPDFIRRRLRADWTIGPTSGGHADDLTVQLVEIMRINTRLRQSIDHRAEMDGIGDGLPDSDTLQLMVDDLHEFLTYQVSSYLDNELVDQPPRRAHSGRHLVTVAQRIRHSNTHPFSEIGPGPYYMRGIPDN
jgi:hypothetical protein